LRVPRWRAELATEEAVKESAQRRPVTVDLPVIGRDDEIDAIVEPVDRQTRPFAVELSPRHPAAEYRDNPAAPVIRAVAAVGAQAPPDLAHSNDDRPVVPVVHVVPEGAKPIRQARHCVLEAAGLVVMRGLFPGYRVPAPLGLFRRKPVPSQPPPRVYRPWNGRPSWPRRVAVSIVPEPTEGRYSRLMADDLTVALTVNGDLV